MTRRLTPVVAFAALSALCFVGCSDDKPHTGTPAPYGLDVRPSNTTCVASARPVENTGVTTQPAFPKLGFSQAVFMLQPPGDASRVFVVERRGTIRVFANDDAVATSSLFIDITARVNSAAGDEAGLLGMAFHPQFATNREVFLSYTGFGGTTNLRSVIARFKSNDGGATLDPASEEILLTVEQPYSNHNGGGIAFGPDGYLYIGLGDGGSGGDPQNHAQNLNDLLGKFLRIDVNGAKPYTIPATNPFRNGGGKPELYAWGLRNPWRWSFDRATGELWAGDVGQGNIEEVDRIVLGGNYGWRIKEGNECYTPRPCSSAGLIDPIVQYLHTEGVSITGGYVYRGTAIPSLVGRFIYGDFGSGRIWAVSNDPITGAPVPQLLVDSPFGIASFGELASGELLLSDYNGGRLYKLVPSGTPAPSNFPQKLSETGCVEPSNPRKPAPGLIPYDVNAPLWSDGALKDRYLALPEGKQIRVGADGDWELPIGTVLMKTFYLGLLPVETRLFMRHPDGTWGGYSYEWDEAGTDATLLPANKSRQVGNQTWYYPTRAECLRCHTSAAGFSLGLETGQLNRDLHYRSTDRLSSQLDTLDHLGLFETPLPAADARARYPSPGSGDPLEQRARAYLHANCSVCHRPNGTGRGPADFRFSTPLAQVGVCNAVPQEGELGVANARLLAPGEPARSLLSVRMHTLGAYRMPPLATRVEDVSGVGVVDAWIVSLTACP